MSKIRTAVFPVGGLGTRFLPATKSIPKEMLPVFNKPLIQYAFEEAIAAGIERFIFITGRNKNAINNHFDSAYEIESALEEKVKKQLLSTIKDWLPSPGSIAFVRQQQPLGLGHAIWCARHYIADSAFAVLLADELFLDLRSDLEPQQQACNAGSRTLGSMIKLYQDSNICSIAADQVPLSKTNQYGIISINGDGLIADLIEKPQNNPPSTLAVVGRYILPNEIFAVLEGQKVGNGGEVQLTDAIKQNLRDHKYKAVAVQDVRIDCGTEWGLFEANMRVGMQHFKGREILQRIYDTQSS